MTPRVTGIDLPLFRGVMALRAKMNERPQLFAPAVALVISVEIAEVITWLPDEVHAHMGADGHRKRRSKSRQNDDR